NGRLVLDPDICRMVRFAPLNLAADDFPSRTETQAVDLILCRNVLMYFASDTASRVIHKLHGALADGGWLVVSPSEGSHTMFSAFTAVSSPAGALYRKAGRPLDSPAGQTDAGRIAAA